MIKVTRLSGETLWLNPEQIRSVEDCGDTLITMLSQEKILVTEKAEQVCEAFMSYKHAICHGGI